MKNRLLPLAVILSLFAGCSALQVGSQPGQESSSASPKNVQNENAPALTPKDGVVPGALYMKKLVKSPEGEVAPSVTKDQVEEVDELAELVEKSAEEPVPPLVTDGEAAVLPKPRTFVLEDGPELGLKNNVFDIPVVYNQSTRKWVNYFLGKGKDWFILYCERAGRYAPLMGKILEDHGLPRDLIFLSMAESGFANKAKSRARAVGPWQFMPSTGVKYGLSQNFYVDERRDPIKATIAASKYLKKLYEEFGSWELAKAGYNAGEGKVNRAIRKSRTENFWDIQKGRYLKSETKNYVPKIFALAIIGKNLETYGMGDIEFYDPWDFDEVSVPANTDLIALSEQIGVPFEELQELNPELLRWQTPPGGTPYNLRIPLGAGEKYDDCCKDKEFPATKFASHTVAKKTTLQSLAKQFRVPTVVLADLNQRSQQESFGKGDVVLLPFREGQNFKEEMYADLYEKPRRLRRHRSSRYRRSRSTFFDARPVTVKHINS